LQQLAYIMDNLERHIKNNQEALDQGEDLNIDAMWENFENKSKPRRIIWIKYAVAAAVSLLIVSSFLMLQVKEKSADELVNDHLAQVDIDLAKDHLQVVSMINQQDSLIHAIGISEELFPELFQQLQEMDELQMQMIQDLDKYQDRRNLIRSLLKHYERKSRILERMLYQYNKELKENNDEEKIYL